MNSERESARGNIAEISTALHDFWCNALLTRLLIKIIIVELSSVSNIVYRFVEISQLLFQELFSGKQIIDAGICRCRRNGDMSRILDGRRTCSPRSSHVHNILNDATDINCRKGTSSWIVSRHKLSLMQSVRVLIVSGLHFSCLVVKFCVIAWAQVLLLALSIEWSIRSSVELPFKLLSCLISISTIKVGQSWMEASALFIHNFKPS